MGEHFCGLKGLLKFVMASFNLGSIFVHFSFATITLGSCFEKEPANNDLVVDAIKEIVIIFQNNSKQPIDLLCFNCGDDVIDIFNEIASDNRSLTPISNINRFSSGQKLSFYSSAILLFRLFDDYKKIEKSGSFLSQRTSSKREYMVFISNLRPKDLLTPASSDLSTLANINFIVKESNTSLSLKTLVFVTEKSCSVLQLNVFNKFSSATKKWESNLFFYNKFHDFHGCNLRFGYQQNYPYTFSGHNKVNGIGCQVNTMVSQIYNFRPSYLLLNGKDSEIDAPLIAGFVHSSNQKYDHTEPINYDYETGFFAPYGEPYTQFEKCFMMFSKEVWILIGVTFSVELFFIKIMKFTSRNIQNMIFSRNGRSAILSFFEVLFGHRQKYLPKKSFPRFLLMTHIVLSLILRTAHQGLFYKLMQADLRKPEIQSIEEAMQKNYTLYINNFDLDQFQYDPLMKR